jgi:hypothetical protein
MVKTQIQFPDGLYKRLKHLAAEQEWSLAETLRRGAELLLATRPLAQSPTTQAWTIDPPANTQLRVDPFADDDWRLTANLGSNPTQLAGISPPMR